MISSTLKGTSSPLNPHEDQLKGLTSAEKAALAKPSENNDYITIFSDPVNFNIKHPLQNSWTLWYDSASKKSNTKDWTQNIKALVTFSTVEDFWGVFNNISKVSELSIGSNFHLFKEGIRPAWEDPANENGGRWMCQPNRQQATSYIDDLWLYSILYCIGETGPDADETCGLVVSARKAFYRISLWTRSSSDAEMLKQVGIQFREAIDLTSKEQLEFQPHNENHKFADKSEKLIV